MKNEQVPPALANDAGQLLGETVPNLDLDRDDVFRDTVLCACGCSDVILDLREQTETRAICTNCSAVFLPDLCSKCGRDCRNVTSRAFKIRCADCA